MALPFPNVPNLPGVPAVPRLPGVVASAGLTIASGVITALLGGSAQQPSLWGVYAVGSQTPALLPDSTLEFSYQRQFDVSDFPIVNGSFSAYNKVQRPFEVQLRLSKGGTQQARAQFLDAIESMANSLTLYNIHTPEKIYRNCTLERPQVARTSNRDAFFLTQVNLFFIQIRQTSAQFTNTGINTANAQSSAALPTANQGNQQPQVPSGVLQSSGQSALQASQGLGNLF